MVTNYVCVVRKYIGTTLLYAKPSKLVFGTDEVGAFVNVHL